MSNVPPAGGRRRRDQQLTTAAVVAHAARLREQGQAELATDSQGIPLDPYARPYMPSESAARKLAQRLGPAAAIAELSARAAQARRVRVEADQHTVRSERRLEKARVQQDRQRLQDLQHLSPGQRIDLALAQLRAVSTAPVAKIGGDKVHGGDHATSPPFSPDADGKARRIADQAVRQIEDELDRARRRSLHTPTARENRDERLTRHTGLTPEQVAIADPEQGLPNQIRERRRRLGLDPDSGNPISQAA